VCVYLLPFVVVDRSHFTGRRAGLLRRFVGFALDFHLAAFLVTIPPIALVLAINYSENGVFSWRVANSESATSWVDLCFFLSAVGLVVLLSLPLSRNRRSPGQVVLGYGLKPEHTLSLGRACRRTLVGYLTLCVGWLSGPLAASRDDRRMWHDRMYGVHPLEVSSAA